MTQAIHIHNEDRLSAVRSFLAAVMDKAGIEAMLVATRLAVKNRIMPMLVSDPARLAEADPLSPAFPVNGAPQLARLTRQPAGARLAAVLRPCEIRAFNELVKLNQGKRDEVVIIGADCPGALSNADFRTFADQYETADAATRAFCDAALAGDPADEAASLTAACRACSHPTPDGADVAMELFGSGATHGLIARARTRKGEAVLAELDLPAAETAPAQRDAVLGETLERRRRYREQMFTSVAGATDSIQGLSTYLADCVNCYNCRAACPVCYCSACVFTTDTFRHEPFQYVQWARRKGSVKMPSETLFFHLTRMAHISTACVGCGQCSNACPNDIPVSDLFTMVARHTQEAFGYGAGLDLSQRPPMCGFKEEEYGEVVGM